MMGWALLVLNFAIASIQRNGFNFAPIVNATLINLYLLKFFYWETGYFNTLDITLDRAGYYLCWGCLTWVQIFYTFSAYFLVAHPSQVSGAGSAVIFLFGIASLTLNYWADYQKEKFKVKPTKVLSSSNIILIAFWWKLQHMGKDCKICPCGIQGE